MIAKTARGLNIADTESGDEVLSSRYQELHSFLFPGSLGVVRHVVLKSVPGI